jgi:hypothetical protein
MSLTKEQIALRARELVSDPVLAEVFSRAEAQAWSDFRNSAADNTAAREAAYCALKAVEEVKQKLHSMAIAPRVEEVNARARAIPAKTVGPDLRSAHK